MKRSREDLKVRTEMDQMHPHRKTQQTKARSCRGVRSQHYLLWAATERARLNQPHSGIVLAPKEYVGATGRMPKLS